MNHSCNRESAGLSLSEPICFFFACESLPLAPPLLSCPQDCVNLLLSFKYLPHHRQWDTSYSMSVQTKITRRKFLVLDKVCLLCIR